MKHVPVALWAVAVLGVLASVGAQFAESSLSARAKPTQIVKVTAADKLLGGPGYEVVGPPEDMVVDVPQATLDQRGPGGEILLDREKLTKLKVYPLRMKSLLAFTGAVKWAGAIVAASFGVAGFLIAKKLKKSPSP